MYRVLIAEDEDIIRKGIAYTMDWVSMGCTIIGEACNGKEGIEQIKELQPDIVLTDIMMPVVDGIEMIKQGQELGDFKAIIMTSYADKISIETFSEELGVSGSYLSRKFKEATGQTYLDFLNKYRIQKAVKLLETGTYKVYEVSEMTGFSDYKYFSTVFKKYTDSSPSDFVK